MELSRGQIFTIVGVVVAVLVLVVGWTLFKPAGAGADGGATQIDHLTTDPQFAQPNANNGDSGGTTPTGNAPM